MIHQQVSHADTYQGIPVNVGLFDEYGLYPVIMERFKERFDWMTDRHCKVLFIRFDMRFPARYPTMGGNQEISRFWKNFGEQSAYRGIDLHYLWVREQSREKHQHYHCIALLDGNKVMNYFHFLLKVQETWGRVLGCDATGLIHFCDKDADGNRMENGIMLCRPPLKHPAREYLQAQFKQDYDRCFYWASYLAKENQKASAPYRVNSFDSSVLR